jgi:glycosyltransferase involved in cell wall biosynthesis
MSNHAEQIILVVPCYNEAHRLDGPAFLTMIEKDPALAIIFVDDGSTDATTRLHADLVAQRPGRIQALSLPKNQGKAEAVRQGLLLALQGPANVVGYVDADLATPPSEIERLCGVMRDRPDCEALLASRVRLMGKAIERRRIRHYLGRVFATSASLFLKMPIYDTQCGTKLLRRTGALVHALSEPFLSRWIFDVELLGRLLIDSPNSSALLPQRVLEEPLWRWTDREGSKLGPKAMVVALLDLARVGIDLARRRRWQ